MSAVVSVGSGSSRVKVDSVDAVFPGNQPKNCVALQDLLQYCVKVLVYGGLVLGEEIVTLVGSRGINLDSIVEGGEDTRSYGQLREHSNREPYSGVVANGCGNGRVSSAKDGLEIACYPVCWSHKAYSLKSTNGHSQCGVIDCERCPCGAVPILHQHGEGADCWSS